MRKVSTWFFSQVLTSTGYSSQVTSRPGYELSYQVIPCYRVIPCYERQVTGPRLQVDQVILYYKLDLSATSYTMLPGYTVLPGYRVIPSYTVFTGYTTFTGYFITWMVLSDVLDWNSVLVGKARISVNFGFVL